MVILSFSVKEAELKSGVKIRTTRPYTPEKCALWQRTLPGGDLMLQGWWKSRRPEGYKLFERQGQDIYRISFGREGGVLWPFIEWGQRPGLFVPMTSRQAYVWCSEEGFGCSPSGLAGLMHFFDLNYPSVVSMVFQSIAFPPEVRA